MKRLVLASLAVATLLASSSAFAAPPWVDRNITLPRHDWAFDVGLGLAHVDVPAPGRSPTGAGLNLEMGVGVTERVELGVRTGLRMGDDARATQADTFGRLFDRQTFGVGGDSMANPEFRVRGALAKHDIAEVALEGRAVVPLENDTRFGVELGLPLMFHVGHSVRLDTGVYFPIVEVPRNGNNDTAYAISVPFDVWIQVSHQVWLGPMTGFRYHHDSPGNERTDMNLGFGFGYQISRIVDFKSMLYIPRVNGDNAFRYYGVGAGVQVRIE
jgi:hypothetical protein